MNLAASARERAHQKLVPVLALSHSARLPRIVLFLVIAASLAGTRSAWGTDQEALFHPSAPQNQWTEFSASGFDRSVCGVISTTQHLPCCGMPLGGISTGCVDIDPNGTFGFCTVFNGYPRQPKLGEPV